MKQFTTIGFADAMATLIRLFNVAPNIGIPVNYRDLEERAAKCGYMVHPECSNEYVMAAINRLQFNPNSTFYRLWSDIESKDRIDLLVDQIYHYMSTYGTGFKGEAWVPNSSPIQIPYNTYFKIMPVGIHEFYGRCMEYISSPIALDDRTTSSFIEFLVWYQNEYGIYIDLDKIGNNDVVAGVCIRLGIMPDTPEMILKVMSYMVFGTPVLIKSRSNLRRLYDIRQTGMIPRLNLTDAQMEALATVFNRNRKFILGFKTRENSAVINRVRTLAKTHHRPMRAGFWESFTQLPVPHIQEHIDREIAKLDNNFKIVRLMSMIISRRQENMNSTCRLFRIRNGSSWIDRHSIASYDPYWNTVLHKLRARLIDNLRQIRIAHQQSSHIAHSYIKMPAGITLSCPMSERKFIGPLPEGSYVDLGSDGSMFGIYWRNEWGTRDYDLHYIDVAGDHIGWCDKFYGQNRDIVFSGDMTSADPEASEIIYIKGNAENGTVWVNRYDGEPDTRLDVFFGGAVPESEMGQQMIDPNNVKLRFSLYPRKQTTLIARIFNQRAYFVSLETGSDNIPKRDPELENALPSKLVCIPLEDILLEAGYELWDDSKIDPDNNILGPAIDLENPDRDVILRLFR